MCHSRVTICSSCGKDTDGLLRCEALDESIEYLCPDCVTDSGYCYRCGIYSSGQERFDFGPYKNYCDTCKDELEFEEAETAEDFDDYNPFADPSLLN